MLRTYLTILGCTITLLSGTAGAADTPQPTQARSNAGPSHQDLESILVMADQGDASSQNYLGFLYATGQTVAKDEKLAFGWFQKAAAQGHPEAIGNLAMMYEKGLGVAQNLQTALSLHRQAAMAGYPISMKRLATLYETGAMGEERNPIKAEMWKNRYKETMKPSTPDASARQSAEKFKTTPQSEKSAATKSPATTGMPAATPMAQPLPAAVIANTPPKPAVPAPTNPPSSTAPVKDKPYFLQIAGKATARETLDVTQKIVEKNLLPQNKKIELVNPDGKTYRINIGPFADAQEAAPYKAKIMALLNPAPAETAQPAALPAKVATAPSAPTLTAPPATAMSRPTGSPVVATTKAAAPVAVAAAPTVVPPAAEKPAAPAPAAKPAPAPATTQPAVLPAKVATAPSAPTVTAPPASATVHPAVSPVAVPPKAAVPAAATALPQPQTVARPAEKAATPATAAKPASAPVTAAVAPSSASPASAPIKAAALDKNKPQYIEVSGKTSAHEATELIQKIVEKGLLPKNMQIELVNPEADHYRVRIGPFASTGNAAPQIAKIKASVASNSAPSGQELVPVTSTRTSAPPAAPATQQPIKLATAMPAAPSAQPVAPSIAAPSKAAPAPVTGNVPAAAEKTLAMAQADKPATKVVRNRYYFIQMDAKNTFVDSLFLTQFLFMKELVHESRRVKLEHQDKQSFRISIGPFSDIKEANSQLLKINQQTFLKSSVITLEKLTTASGEGEHDLFVQLNAQGNLDNAITLTQSLMEKDLLAPKMSAEVVNFGNGNYRVRFGPFKDAKEAGQSTRNLAKQLTASPILVNLDRMQPVEAK